MILLSEIYYFQSDNFLPSKSNKKRQIKYQISISIKHDIFESKSKNKSSINSYIKYMYKKKFHKYTLNNQIVGIHFSNQWIYFINLKFTFDQFLIWMKIKFTTMCKKYKKNQKFLQIYIIIFFINKAFWLIFL